VVEHLCVLGYVGFFFFVPSVSRTVAAAKDGLH